MLRAEAAADGDDLRPGGCSSSCGAPLVRFETMCSPETQADSMNRSVDRVIAIALLALLAAGCGRSSKAPEARSHADRADRSTAAAPKKKRPSAKHSGKKPAKDPGTAESHVAAIPRKEWSNVFFSAPLAILAEKGSEAPPTGDAPGAANSAGASSTDASSTDASPADASSAAAPAATTPPAQAANETPAEPASGDAENWAVLLSGEDLGNEAKAIRASLTDKLRSVGKYSGHYKELRVDAATLAVLAAIAAEHPDPPSWRAHAKYIRDISAQIVRSAVANGDKFYKPTRIAFEKLDALLSGSKPPDVEEAAEKVPFSEIASRIPLMKRLERAFNYLKLSVNTEAIFKKESAKVAHEAAIIAALSRVIATPGYDDADLDEYRAFAQALQQSGLGVAEAAQNDDFTAYTAALDRASKACTNCHTEFKNN
jgi:hypothetical protein